MDVDHEVTQTIQESCFSNRSLLDNAPNYIAGCVIQKRKDRILYRWMWIMRLH